MPSKYYILPAHLAAVKGLKPGAAFPVLFKLTKNPVWSVKFGDKGYFGAVSGLWTNRHPTYRRKPGAKKQRKQRRVDHPARRSKQGPAKPDHVHDELVKRAYDYPISGQWPITASN
jgi:hypothetical protein